MGLIVLHSGHYSKIFIRLMGTKCSLIWRVAGERERLWVCDPAHPIARGIDRCFDLPHEEMPDEPSIPRDREARPSLDEVLALRADRMATVRQVLADLTDAKLAGRTVPVTEPGYPEPESFPVRRCLQAILIEEWEHRLYAERDFDLLQARQG